MFMMANFWWVIWQLTAVAALAAPWQRRQAGEKVQVSFDSDGIIRQDAPLIRQSPSLQQVKQSSTKRAAANGTIAVLLKAENRSLWELRFALVPSLMRNVRFQTPVTIMYEGDRQLVVDAAERMKGHKLLHPVQFVDVSKYFTPTKDEISMLAAPGVRMADFGMGYRKMCEFWAAHVHTLPALAQYQYLWRLDTDSNVTEPVFVNLYNVMRARDSVFGYLLLQKAVPEACQGLQKATEDFYKGESELEPVSTDAQTFLHNFEANRCPHWNTNFQLMDLNFFRSSHAYANYMKHLTENVHGFVKYRWGDHIVQTLGVLLQVPPHRTLCMQPWVPGYEHQGKMPNCDSRIYEPPLLGEVVADLKSTAVQVPAYEFPPLGSVLAVLAFVICLGGAAWYLLKLKYPNAFRSKEAIKAGAADREAIEAEIAQQQAQQLQVASALLDSRLDYMVSYLENGCQHVTPEVRATVFHHVKAAMAWKEQKRTAQQLQAKAAELDAAMMEITQHL